MLQFVSYITLSLIFEQMKFIYNTKKRYAQKYRENGGVG